jgi:hypothetical protein
MEKGGGQEPPRLTTQSERAKGSSEAHQSFNINVIDAARVNAGNEKDDRIDDDQPGRRRMQIKRGWHSRTLQWSFLSKRLGRVRLALRAEHLAIRDGEESATLRAVRHLIEPSEI